MEPDQNALEPPIIMLAGERVALGPPRRDLLPLYLRWLNDLEYARWTSHTGPLTAEALARAYARDTADPRQAHFTIYERATLRPIGGASLTDITGWTATFAIGIGEKDCWGKGYGTEATRLVLEYGFSMLGLHNIMLTVHGDHERALRAYRRAGFQVIGRRRQVIRRAGQLHDLVYMDCLAIDFKPATAPPLNA
jgi:RimJ/RimL family protein N-acetyltransferase